MIQPSSTNTVDRWAWLTWPVLLVYTALILVWSYFHEPWRDEVGVITLVIQSHSLPELLQVIKSYGHPALWFVIMYGAYHIVPSYSVLKIVNLTINILAAFIFLKKAPFSWTNRILFLLGYFPLYYFPTVNRNYGLCLLLLLLIWIFFAQRWKRILWLSVVLFFFANTHAIGLIFTAVITGTLILELIFLKPAEASLKKALVGLAVIIMGMAVSVWQLHVDSHSTLVPFHAISLSKILHAVGIAVLLPGKTFPHVLGGEHGSFVTLAIFGCYFLLRRQPVSLTVMALSTIGMSLFFQLIYPAYSPYHECFMYLLLIFAFWMAAQDSRSSSRVPAIFLTAVLLSQVVIAYPAIQKDVRSDFSSSKRLAQWIQKQRTGKDYVLMSEPDYLPESMPYYVSNTIYIPRERRFGKLTKFTVDNQKVFSLEDFLRSAQELKAEGMEVLLLMGQPLKPEGPFEVHFSYDSIFTYSPESLKLWEAKTKKVASFQDAVFENYDVFVLK